MQDLLKINNLMYGYKDDNSVIKIDEKLVNLAILLANTKFNDDYVLKPTGYTNEIILNDSRSFLESKFKLHNVSYASDQMIKDSLDGLEVDSIDLLLDKYNKTSILVSPFDIPINFVNKPYYHGVLSIQDIEFYEEEFLKRMKIFIKEIELSNIKSEFSSLCHIHEIMHMELIRLKGAVTDYLNSDVLSIFIELIYAYEKDKKLLKKDYLNRINYFLMEFDTLYKYYYENDGSITIINASICSKYIISILKALYLFYIYINGDILLKKFIIEKIQEVIDGKRTLEETLEELDVTYDNSLNKDVIIKRLL